MALAYASGEEIQTGDLITYHGEPGQVEFVARKGDPETEWYAEQFGGGIMLLVPSFDRVFVDNPDEDEDLEFVTRGTPPQVT